ncbi:MAG: membrane protein of unknown function [Promethearchaeota archaeon]|nr:MAG: membrane protein of unknown function [Candidatus Lokiarchaeota archaeon]
MKFGSSKSTLSEELSFEKRLNSIINNDEGSFLKIWEQFPSFKDTNVRLFLLRVIFLSTLINFFMIALFITTSKIVISIAFGLGFLGFFLYAFADSFRFHSILKGLKMKKSISQIYPFKDIFFWMDEDDDSTLFFSHRKELVLTGLKVFRITVIPENVHPALNNFLHGLNNLKIPFTYQVVQKPQSYSQEQSYLIEVYLCIYIQKKGYTTQRKMENVREALEKRAENLRSAFFANLHHFKTQLIRNNSLIEALRTVLFKLPENKMKEQNLDASESYFPFFSSSLLKLSITVFYIIAFDILLGILGTNIILMIGLNLFLVFGMIFLFWRELLFFPISNLLHTPRSLLLNPFHDLTFFSSKDSLFIYDDGGITGVQVFNLQHIKPEIYNRKGKFINKTERFFRVLLSQKVPFTYTIHTEPLNYSKFYKKAHKLLKESELHKLEGLDDSGKKQSWMEYRTGIWKTTLLISASCYMKTEDLNEDVMFQVERLLEKQAHVLRNAFLMNFSGFYPQKLKTQKLDAALRNIFLKDVSFSLSGTNLNYLLLQGKTLQYLIEISDEFKRGLETRIAAEFTTPLHLKNGIIFGNTVNTEYLGEEVPAGLLLDQTQNLILVGGLRNSRDLLAMKIVIELMLKNRPAIIFDFKGEWTRIIRYFSDTSLADQFLYFKLGKTFRVNPIYSDMPYDQNNLEYLDYMFDAYALAFRQSKKMVENFKSLIKSNDNLDLPSLALKLENQKEWEKNSLTESAVSLFRDFTDQFLFFSGQGEDQEKKITISNFLTNNKTIIIDLSLLKDLEQKLFISFIFVSKMIHYVNHSQRFVPKTIYLPNTDIFFDRWYLDKVSNYGKIGSFLEPLFNNGFGIIMAMSQVNNVHPTIFSYFPNILSFRSIDSREIKVLKNYMNLQELQATGFYSSKRKDAYQVHYLMTLPKNEILMKRSDFDRSFPVRLAYNSLLETFKMTSEEINTYMRKLGYDVKLSEEEILKSTKRNLFEKDLGNYSIFIDEIIIFLKALKLQHNLGNLYKTKLKEELKKILYPKAALLFQKSRRKIMEARDKILELLIKHGYIMEAHPEKASGNQTIRTSYVVSPKFEIACEDHEKSSLLEEEINDEFSFDQEEYEECEDTSEMRERETNEAFETPSNGDIVRKRLLKAMGGVLIYNMAKLERLIGEKKYEQAKRLERKILPMFIVTLGFEDEDEKDIEDFSQDELVELLLPIVDHELFPFDIEDMQFFLRRMDFSDIITHEKTIKTIQENYHILSEMVKKIQYTLFGGNHYES